MLCNFLETSCTSSQRQSCSFSSLVVAGLSEQWKSSTGLECCTCCHAKLNFSHRMNLDDGIFHLQFHGKIAKLCTVEVLLCKDPEA